MPLHFGGRMPTAGQLPSLQSYTQFLLFFPNQNGELELAEYHNQIISTLKDASRQLVSRFPWLGGQVANTGHRYEGKEPGNSGIFEVIPNLSAGSDGGRMVRVVSKERFDIKYSDIVDGRGATRFLTSGNFSEKKLMPEVYDLSHSAEPVLRLEITFVDGGVVLCISGLHLGVDMTGLGEIVKLLGKACCGEDLGVEEKEAKKASKEEKGEEKEGSEDAKDDTIPDWETLITKHPSAPITTEKNEEEPTKATWKYIHFSKDNLETLKQLASAAIFDTASPSDSPSWISTDDALTSFLWHRILLARSPRLSPTTISTTLCRALNARRYLSPPLVPTSLEHCVSCTYTPLSLTLFNFSNPIKTTLPLLATNLRDSINEQATPKSLKTLFNIITETKDKDTLSFGSSLSLSTTDILISSGAGLGVYNVNFGPLLGNPELVRRPWVECKDGGSEGIGYFMPKDREGGVDVLMCLRREDWMGLGRDVLFMGFGEVIG